MSDESTKAREELYREFSGVGYDPEIPNFDEWLAVKIKLLRGQLDQARGINYMPVELTPAQIRRVYEAGVSSRCKPTWTELPKLYEPMQANQINTDKIIESDLIRRSRHRVDTGWFVDEDGVEHCPVKAAE